MTTIDTRPGSSRDASRWRWEDLSIRAKLPICVAVLVAVTSGIITTAAYLRVRTFVVGTASDRLYKAATQVSDILGKSVRQRGVALQQVAKDPGVGRALRTGEVSPEARDVLIRLATPATTSQIGLFDVNGQKLLATNDSFNQAPSPAAIETLSKQRSEPYVTPLMRAASGRELSYLMTVALYDGERHVGYLVERRVTGGAGDAVTLMTGLIGTQAKLTFGNADGSLWTDFQLPNLPNATATGQLLTSVSSSEPLFVRVAPIPGAPWLSGVGFPMSPVLLPVRRFLLEALAITVVVVCLGIGAAWVGSRRITGPLSRLTAAAESVAQAQSAPALTVDRTDELGRLAASFNFMAQQVTQSRVALEQMVNDLEQRVEARTAALQGANRELEAFSYSVSHDLRAPLRAVTGFSKILLEDHAPKLDADAKQCVETIARRAQHMGQLIDDLLAFSRLGRTTIGREPIDMHRLVRVIVDDVVRAEPTRSITWDVQPLPAATGEPALLQQVLVNLIHNAVKFTRTRADATISIGTEATERGLAYFVRDTGVGFDMRYADRLFGVFQRLHGQHEFEGTGVGLAIVHRIVERHGGSVWADAALGRGATFYFTLPSVALGEAA